MSVETLAQATAEDDANDIIDHLLHYQLFTEAERVRWRLEDVPWSSIDASKVSPQLRMLVRQVTLAELTTYAATRRFLQEFSDDIDFTQWMSVWFYEETKHPHALIRWMHSLGENFSAGEIVRGRITAPFMRSRFAMLATNVISEVHAAAAYTGLVGIAKEPVLQQIARHLAGDEARHATGFYTYARRALERSRKPEEDRLDAFKVLHMWLNANTQVQHPVNTVGLRTSNESEMLREWSEASADQTVLEHHSVIQQQLTRKRALGLIGNLLGVTLHGPQDVVEHIRELTPAARKSSTN